MTVGVLRTPLVLLVEVLWGFAAVALFVQVFGRGDGPAPSLAAVAIVVVGSYGVARWLQASTLDETQLRIAGLVATVAGLTIAGAVGYATLPSWGAAGLTGDGIGESAHIVAGMLAMLVLWLRGVRRGQLSGASLDDVLASSSVGFLFVVVAALSDPPVRGAVSWGAFAFAYSLIVLLTLAALQAPAPEAGSTPFVRRYGLGLAAVGGVAFAVAALAAVAATQLAEFADVLAEPAQDVGEGIERYALRPLFNAIAYPLAWFAALIGSLIPDAQEQFTPEPPPEVERPEPEEQARPLWQTIIFATIIGAGALAVAAIIVALIWYAFRRFARGDETDARDRREQVEPATSLSDDLAALFGALGRRLRRPRSGGSAVAIRRLYAEVLAAAGEQGLERPPATTPARFAPALDAHFASGLPSEITSAFVESRYGERVVDDARVRALTERWRQQLA